MKRLYYRFFYNGDFVGFDLGPYTLVLYAPHEWGLYWSTANGVSIQVGPIGWFWFSGDLPF